MTFFTVPMMLTCACIVFCNLLVMAKIIKMKIKPDPHFKLSEQNSTTQVINHLISCQYDNGSMTYTYPTLTYIFSTLEMIFVRASFEFHDALQ